MFLIVMLAVISFLLLFAGSLGVVLTVRRYRRRLEKNKVAALAEMMKIAQDKISEKEGEDRLD